MKASSELVREVFSRVLEKQVFLFAEAMPIGEMDGSADWVEARMSFHGPFGGSLSLALPKDAEIEIAANFLGKDADDPDVAKYAEDSFKEILNVVCGHMLTALAGEEPVFDLSIPKVHPVSGADWTALADMPGALGFDVEGHAALLRFQVTESENH
ncbi:MAG: chemotaxis protein CheX [Fibrobacterota bacterium]|nr:chemotaxis protein CheX [Fibrobacterota bacterium]